MNLPTRTELESAMFKHRCWNRGRIIEAAYALLLGAHRYETHQRTGVAPVTVSKLCKVLAAEFGFEVKSGYHTGMLQMTKEEKAVVREAADSLDRTFSEYCAEILIAAACQQLKRARPKRPFEIDWEEAKRLAGPEPVPAQVKAADPRRAVPAPKPVQSRVPTPHPVAPAGQPRPEPRPAPPKSAPPPTPAPDSSRTIEVPRDPDVEPASKHVDRRNVIRDRFRKLHTP